MAVVRELARAADVSPNTDARLERSETMRASTPVTIQTALKKSGVTGDYRLAQRPVWCLRSDSSA